MVIASGTCGEAIEKPNANKNKKINHQGHQEHQGKTPRRKNINSDTEP
jgi:hypothetical protein